MATKKATAATAPQRITAWSYSRLRDYRKCPRYAKYKHVDRMKEPGNQAMDRGSAIHTLAENFAKKTAARQKCPPELAHFEEEFRALQKRNVIVEEQWAFTCKWEETGWFDKDAWCRVKTDLCFQRLDVNHLVIIDHKTGKVSGRQDDYDEQLKLFATAGLIKFPTVDAVDPRLWYLDHGVELPEEETLFTRDQLPDLIKYWDKATKAMLTDTRFAPKPNDGCRWCHFSRAKGGPCEY